MPAEKPFPFRGPGDSQEQAADRISKQLQEADEWDGAEPTSDKDAADCGDSERDQ